MRESLPIRNSREPEIPDKSSRVIFAIPPFMVSSVCTINVVKVRYLQNLSAEMMLTKNIYNNKTISYNSHGKANSFF